MHANRSERSAMVEHTRRAQIVTAANDHFRQYGYEKTTVGDLAKAIGFSTAYVYKFFSSKQAIGEAICGICLGKILSDLDRVANGPASAAQRLGGVFRVLVQHARDLSLHDSKLQEMVTAAHREGWESFEAHKAALRAVISRIVEEGRRSGEFERKTPIDETCQSIVLVMEPFWNPVLWTEKLGQLEEQAAVLAALVLRSMVP